MKRVFVQFSALLILLLSVGLGTGWAQAVPTGVRCDAITWNANTEPDLAGYRLYVEKDGTAGPPIALPKTATSYTCAQANIAAPATGSALFKLHLTAIDSSGNESLPSNSVSFRLALPIMHGLSVSVVGSGTVSSTPSGIQCPTDCQEDYGDGMSVTLSAQPASGQKFVGWSGACTGQSSSCTVTMSQSQNVTATFSPLATSPHICVTVEVDNLPVKLCSDQD